MKRLPKIGDKVMLNQLTRVYGCGFNTSDGYAYILEGTVGICNNTNIPAVRVNRQFACVDFPWNTPLYDCGGNLIDHDHRKYENLFRVAVYPEQCELVKE